MKLLRRQIALAVTGLFLTGYTVMAADTPAAVAPAAIQHKNEIVQTETVPSLTKREKQRRLKSPAHPDSCFGSVGRYSRSCYRIYQQRFGTPVTVTTGNRPAALFIASSIPGSANTAYADFTKKAYASYHEQMNFFVLQLAGRVK